MYTKEYMYSRDLDYLLSEYKKYYRHAMRYPKRNREIINILDGQLKIIKVLKSTYQNLGLYVDKDAETLDFNKVHV